MKIFKFGEKIKKDKKNNKNNGNFQNKKRYSNTKPIWYLMYRQNMSNKYKYQEFLSIYYKDYLLQRCIIFINANIIMPLIKTFNKTIINQLKNLKIMKIKLKFIHSLRKL